MPTAVIYLTSDHAGHNLRAQIHGHIVAKGCNVIDLGPNSDASVDYPDFGVKLALAMKNSVEARGIAICGSGIGISIAVNRFSWIRAALVNSIEATMLSRLHNDANVLAFGERLISHELALKCIDTFLDTKFEGKRHRRRVEKLRAIGTQSRTL